MQQGPWMVIHIGHRCKCYKEGRIYAWASPIWNIKVSLDERRTGGL